MKRAVITTGSVNSYWLRSVDVECLLCINRTQVERGLYKYGLPF